MRKDFEWIHLIESIGQVAFIEIMYQLKESDLQDNKSVVSAS